MTTGTTAPVCPGSRDLSRLCTLDHASSKAESGDAEGAIPEGPPETGTKGKTVYPDFAKRNVRDWPVADKASVASHHMGLTIGGAYDYNRKTCATICTGTAAYRALTYQFPCTDCT